MVSYLQKFENMFQWSEILIPESGKGKPRQLYLTAYLCDRLMVLDRKFGSML